MFRSSWCGPSLNGEMNMVINSMKWLLLCRFWHCVCLCVLSHRFLLGIGFHHQPLDVQQWGISVPKLVVTWQRSIITNYSLHLRLPARRQYTQCCRKRKKDLMNLSVSSIVKNDSAFYHSGNFSIYCETPLTNQTSCKHASLVWTISTKLSSSTYIAPVVLSVQATHR